MKFFIGGKNGGGFAIGNGFHSDVVAVVVIQKQQVVVALAGGQREAASQVAVALASG